MEGVELDLCAVILTVRDEEPQVLVVQERCGLSLPSGGLDVAGDRTLELGLRRWVRGRAGLDLGYVEQLYSFGDRGRSAAARLVTVAYLALVDAQVESHGGLWSGVYRYFPWEDWRSGGPAAVSPAVVASLRGWSEAGEGREQRQRRWSRVEIAFGMGGAPWDEERVLDRYELLYGAGLVAEAGGSADEDTGAPLCVDHRRMLASALSRVRGKLKYRPVVFELLPPLFTLFQLQRVVEALAGRRLHKQNFRRLVLKGGLVEGTPAVEQRTGGRPAALFRFRHEVLRERPAPGLALPGMRLG